MLFRSQRVFVSDIRKSEAVLGWRPQVAWRQGIDRLVAWIAANRELFM